MKRLFVIAFLLLSITAMGIPISFLISNNEVSLGLTASPIKIKIGYPRLSVFLGSKTYVRIIYDESTPLVFIEASVNLINFKMASFSIGETSKFGQLEGRIDNGKILEVGRNFLTANVNFSLFRAILNLEYSRFYSSFNYNSSKNIIFLAPPNYEGDSPNMLSLYASYSLGYYENFEFTFFTHMNAHFSDTFVFENPSIEIGISLSTTTENLQNTFRMTH